tara:strand:+ start:327 stop:1283 length:957 start_codon:yes stop_codon:yes gene_type:complete
MPKAKNFPILTDSERHEIGIIYKRSGKEKAIQAGKKLVSGPIKEQRVDSWINFIGEPNNCWIYCWRGGLRSEIAQQWIKERGVTIPRLKGGFKALRNYFMSVLENAPSQKSWYVLGGRTGSGKTLLIRDRHHLDSIDLEGLANHRGSAFGDLPDTQPTPINFENYLATAFLQHPTERVLVEDEGRTIGRLAIPTAWYNHMRSVPLIIMETPFLERVQNIKQEYVVEPLSQGRNKNELHEHYQNSLKKISRRLGGLGTKRIRQCMKEAFKTNEHESWIAELLNSYYDPAYDYQIAKKTSRIVFQGDDREVGEFLDELHD